MTRGQAIAAKCKDCIYDKCAPGNWRQQVTACTSVSCPLYEYRPRSKSVAKSGTPQTELSQGVSQ